MKIRIKNDIGATNLVPVVLAVVIVFCMLFVGGYVNGSINDKMQESLGTNPPEDSAEFQSKARMNNSSWAWDDALDIIQIVIIISILGAMIGAIVLFTKFH